MRNTLVTMAHHKFSDYFRTLVRMYNGAFFNESSEINLIKRELNLFSYSSGRRDLNKDMHNVLFDLKHAEKEAKTKLNGKGKTKNWHPTIEE